MLRGGLIRRRLVQHVVSRPGAHRLCRAFQTFAEGDYVWLHHRDGMRPHWRQVPAPGSFFWTRKGAVAAETIIGRSTGDTIETSKQEELRLTQPTLGEHILYVERLVTPIYPRDANLIVSRLDLHPDPSPAADTSTTTTPPLEILEAGTGMGGLSLFLARALHAANPPCSTELRRACASDPASLSPSSAAAVVHYRLQRRAILHTVERSARFAENARRVIGSFRGGLYAPTIDQHVGDVGKWLESQLAVRGGPFLAHTILDLPNADVHMPLVSKALKPDGLFILWAPSISQVENAVRRVAEDQLPLVLDEMLELGTNMSGGRPWTVQLTRLRSPREDVAPTVAEESDETEEMSDDAERSEGAEMHNGADTDDGADSPRFGMVARPRVVMLSGGGFLAVFRRRWDGDHLQMPREKWAKGELKAGGKVYRKKASRRASGSGSGSQRVS